MAPLPFDPGKLSPQDRALYDAMVARRKAQGAPFGGPYAALMNHPQLCKRVEELGSRTSYTYMLEALRMLVRDGVPMVTDADDAVVTMQIIDDIYRAAGMQARPTCSID